MGKVEGEENGFIAKGFKLEGTLDVVGPLRVNGRVKGTVRSKSQVVLGESAEIEGEVQCAHLSVAGKVNGNVHCTERLEILSSGVVEGDVHAPSLGIEPGGILEGRCHMRALPGSAEAGKPAKPAIAVARPSAEVKEPAKVASPAVQN
ncbi:MAG: bactofilin family protein [Candidatus Acidiferrales bacterium]